MKKILLSFAVAAVALGFSSCKETWDDNPTLKTHEGVIVAHFLNNPVMADQPIMLTTGNRNGTFSLTANQPDFGYAANASYRVQVSLTEDFAEMREIDQTFMNASYINPLNERVAAAIEELSGVQSEADLPLPYQPVYMRVISYIAQSPDDTMYQSNVVSFKSVSADWLAIWVADVPVEIYLRGGMNDWGTPKEGQFVTGPKNDVWCLYDVSIAAGVEFKIADPAWGAINLGSAAPLEIGVRTQCVDNGGNMSVTEDFHGTIQLELEKGVYYVTLVPA